MSVLNVFIAMEMVSCCTISVKDIRLIENLDFKWHEFIMF